MTENNNENDAIMRDYIRDVILKQVEESGPVCWDDSGFKVVQKAVADAIEFVGNPPEPVISIEGGKIVCSWPPAIKIKAGG